MHTKCGVRGEVGDECGGEDISKPNPPDSCNDWGPELMEDEEKGGVKNWTDKTGGR